MHPGSASPRTPPTGTATATEAPTAEHARLAGSPTYRDPWRRWGPYLAGRQWGTVREDYSADGDAWTSFPFDHSHLRAYRWGEDGISGLTDVDGFLNLALAAWNRHDDRLKERWFGLVSEEGNHGEDVKELWWDLDATPTHSWARQLYRYPQRAYPYQQLRDGNRGLGRAVREYELTDTGVLDEDRFFDLTTTHAKAGPEDVLVTITATNHGPEAAPLDLVPQLWFRNTWRWGDDERVPVLRDATVPGSGHVVLMADHRALGQVTLAADGSPEVMVCDNESNAVDLWSTDSVTTCPKDGINRALVAGDASCLRPERTGTKAGLVHRFDRIGPGESVTVRLRLTVGGHADPFGPSFDETLADRRAEADAFYDEVIPRDTGDEDRLTARRAFAGLLWGMQLYRYDVSRWLDGDPGEPAPPPQRHGPDGRNVDWRHLDLAHVLSMPDAWEYPWFATWDSAFHLVALAHVDPAGAKEQVLTFCRVVSQHPNGALPAYEWDFSDTNPPVLAWAAWEIFELDGAADREFLARAFTKLLLDYTWWVNRQDPEGSNLFEGGFLGMDNISVFDRSQSVPPGRRLEQSDATSWVGFYTLSMLRISLELAREDRSWDSVATTFVQRFAEIRRAIGRFGTSGISLWHEEDRFFYDVLVPEDDDREPVPMRVRSYVGLLPLLAVAIVPDWVPGELSEFTERYHRLRDADEHGGRWPVFSAERDGATTLRLVAEDQLRSLLGAMLDEEEFLAPHGIRSLSAAHRDGTVLRWDGHEGRISYEPAEGETPMFGGNSNWRGPVWWPINALLVDALRTFGAAAGRDLEVEVPTGSGNRRSLSEAAGDLEDRLVAMFRIGPDGRRPADPDWYPTGALWQAHPVFSEYFDGDTGAGLGSTHQTGWTAMVAHLICTTAGHSEAPAGRRAVDRALLRPRRA